MRLVARGFTIASAGVDCIEHGYFVDDEAIARMKGAGCWLVITSASFLTMKQSTICIAGTCGKLFESSGLVRETLTKAINADLKVAVGTDGLVGKIADEICFLVAAGMTSLDHQGSDTRSARLLGIDDEAGSLERGKRADVISVVGNPLEDVSVLENVHLVMKDGQRLDLILDQMSTLAERATNVNTTMIELKAAHTTTALRSSTLPHRFPRVLKMAGIHAEMGAAALRVQAPEVKLSALDWRNKGYGETNSNHRIGSNGNTYGPETSGLRFPARGF